jgi:hypothetical protein
METGQIRTDLNIKVYTRRDEESGVTNTDVAEYSSTGFNNPYIGLIHKDDDENPTVKIWSTICIIKSAPLLTSHKVNFRCFD